MNRMITRAAMGLLLTAICAQGGDAVAGSDLVPWSAARPTPQLALKDLAGNAVNLSDLKGKVVLVNFWATWCAPCIEEMPAMQALRDKLGLGGFEVLAVNYQEGTARINDFLKKRPLKLTIVRDADGGAKAAWGVKVFPTSFIVDPDGRIRYTVVGDVDWSSSRIQSQIRELLPKT
jgi:thiol-disulfide isomerase/thioredoxin